MIDDDIAAYEVVFERNGTMSCFQIIPNVDNPMKDFRVWNKRTKYVLCENRILILIYLSKNEFKLILKDPSLTINNDRFLFYFSKVSIRPLIRCEKEDDRDDMMVMNQRKSAVSLRDYTGKRLCALDKLQSQKIDVGIELAKTANPMQRPIRYLEPGLSLYFLFFLCLSYSGFIFILFISGFLSRQFKFLYTIY